MYSILYSPAALKDLKSLPVDIAEKIVKSIKEIQDSPKVHVKKLKGFTNSPLYSLRVGEYRVIMSIEDENLIVFVIEVGHRSKIYRKY
jgi:mRNA interferase RelE/StbE